MTFPLEGCIILAKDPESRDSPRAQAGWELHR